MDTITHGNYYTGAETSCFCRLAKQLNSTFCPQRHSNKKIIIKK